MASKHPRQSAYTKKIIEVTDHGLYCGKTPQIQIPKPHIPFEKLSLHKKITTVEHSLHCLDRWVTQKERSCPKTFEGKLRAKREFSQEIAPINERVSLIKGEIAGLAEQGDRRSYQKLLDGILWEKEVITILFEQGMQVSTTDFLNKCLQVIQET